MNTARRLCVNNKPWGYYVDYYRSEEDVVVFKTITVNPGQKLSLQRHANRNELWVVISGTAKVTAEDRLGGTMFHELKKGQFIKITKNEVHRLENPTDEDLIVAEMQWGICSEDDIERIEDDYNRG